MIRRSTIWLVVAVLFTVVNVGGAVYAAQRGELLHASVHAGLLLVGAYLVWLLTPRRYTRRIWGPAAPGTPPPGEHTDRLTHLEQSIDAVAVEVERIGEGQRFMTRLVAAEGTPPASREAAAEPIETKVPRAAPDVRRD